MDEIEYLHNEISIMDKKIYLLKEFIVTLNTEMKKEMNKDGWCTLKVDYETIKKFEEILEEV